MLLFSFLSALANLTFEDETKDEYVNLMDLNTESCVDGEALLQKMDHYRVDLVIPQKIENGTITVYFNQTVDCKKRRVLCLENQSPRSQLQMSKHFALIINISCLIVYF